jgi:ABC-type bacteriocin/lantibiotic exporter with double-glycine peptidase domain
MKDSQVGTASLLVGVASMVVTLIVFGLLFTTMREELAQDKKENDLLLEIVSGVEKCKEE